MKKISILLAVLMLLGGLGCAFREQLIDLLPIDQSCWMEAEGVTVHLGKKGEPDTGWFSEGEARFYLDPARGGAVTVGWAEIDGSRYCFAEDGTMRTGWVDGFYLDADGRPHTGWLEDGAVRRFFLSDGTVAQGWATADGQDYFFDEGGTIHTGWAERDGRKYLLGENGLPLSGWVEDGEKYYLDADGACSVGWQEINGQRYYFTEDGTLYTGWLEQGDQIYYLTEDGTAARGRMEVDGETMYFTSKGARILLINRWNPLPNDYTVELGNTDFGGRMAVSCLDALNLMLSDCKAAGNNPAVISGYRSYWDQVAVFDGQLVTCNGNYAQAMTIAAIPGTSEHHLGTAADIIDPYNRTLNVSQHNTKTEQWLLEHCWDYGFILRYTDGSSDYTGIIYEPWHYRYVGTELSLELKELGICLEQYLDELTGEGPSCGGIGR